MVYKFVIASLVLFHLPLFDLAPSCTVVYDCIHRFAFLPVCLLKANTQPIFPLSYRRQKIDCPEILDQLNLACLSDIRIRVFCLSVKRSRRLAVLSTNERNAALTAIHKALAEGREEVLAANAKDLEAANQAAAGGTLSQSLVKRLDLGKKGKYEDMLQGILDVRDLEDPST